MVTDFFNHVIRRTTPSGYISTLAGGPSGRYRDGPFSQALFYFPISIKFDSNDIVYIADIYNHAIRVLYMNGTVGTLLDPSFGHKDGALVETKSDPLPVWLWIQTNQSLLQKQTQTLLADSRPPQIVSKL